MKKIFFALAALVLFSSHVMYLKLDDYFLEPNTSATIQLFNGTFDKSDNVIDRNRMLDASLVGVGQRIKVDDSQWTEKDSITILNFQTGDPGTWVAGVSTAPRSIEMTSKDFNEYLVHEGILDMLEWRQNNKALDSAAVEKYSKHVKAIFQVGDERTGDWQTPLGYPIEFVPFENPYDINTGDSINIRLLFKGEPLANQLVYADFRANKGAHSHDDTEKHGHSHDETSPEHTHKEESEVGHSHGEESGHTHTHDEGTPEHTHDEDGGHTHTHDEGTPDHTHDDGLEHSHHSDEEGGHNHSHDGKTEHNTNEKDDQSVTHSHGEKGEHSHDKNTENGHSHENTEESHQHTSGQKLRTDSDGIVTVKLTADGIWYLQTILLVNTKEEGLTHESNWATLTFEVTHAHGEDTHTHEDEHEHEHGIPSYVYWVGSLLLVLILFFWFNRKK